MASKGRPFRVIEIEGYQVLLGKSAADNERLSLDLAEPGDLWLHAAGGVAGSHVVIQNPGGGPVPPRVVEQAAAHAAWYSKARGAPVVEVHLCPATHVTKPRGAPLGQVAIHGFRSIRVAPKPAGDA